MTHAPIEQWKFSDPIEVSSPTEAAWYHYIDWPDGTTTRGRVDLRHNVEAYLGRLNFRDQTVLEIGPASGFLTKEMEARGASVTCIDLPDERAWDTVPRTDLSVEVWNQQRQSGTKRLRAGWWYTRKIFENKSRVAYCGLEGMDLIKDKVRFDIVLFGAVLQHIRHPIDALYTASLLTRKIIVSELFVDNVEATKIGASFIPAVGNNILGSWWALSSGLVAQVLATAGFVRVSHEVSTGRIWELKALSEVDDAFVDRKFYTSVFERKSP